MAPSFSPSQSPERRRISGARRAALPVTADIPPGFEIYARSPDLTELDLPEAMDVTYSVGDGVWTLVQVLDGSLFFRLGPAATGTVLLSAGGAAAIPPRAKCRLQFVGRGRCFLEFHVRKQSLAACRLSPGHC